MLQFIILFYLEGFYMIRKPTLKQCKLIAKMEQYLDVRFKGNTIAEASAFISSNLQALKKKEELFFDVMYYHDAY